AAFAVGLGLDGGHGRGCPGHHVERADDVQGLDELEDAELVGAAVTVDDPTDPAGTRTVDHDAQIATVGRLVDGLLAVLGIGDVPADEVGTAADLGDDFPAPLLVAVEHGDPHAPAGELAGGGLSEARCATGDD